MRVYLIKDGINRIRTYHKGYKGPFSYYKRQYNELVKWYEMRSNQYPPEQVKTVLNQCKITVYMADETSPLHKIEEYP